MGRVEGKVGLVTGAARGQGRRQALRLAEEGADIIALDFSGKIDSTSYAEATPSDLQETVAEIQKLGRRAISGSADIRDLEALSCEVDRCVPELAAPDIVVANAGIFSTSQFAQLASETWAEMIDINLTGTYNTVRASLPHLEDGASIVLISSILGLRGSNGASHYSAAKHGVIGLMRSLASELGPRNIRVNAVSPGTVPTEMVMNDSVYSLFSPDADDPSQEDFTAASEAAHLLPTPWVEPQDIANAVLFLASDEARFVTGIALPVDAGYLAK